MRRVVAALWVLLGPCACATTLLDQRVETQAKGFTLAVTEVTDGPNTYERGTRRLEPDDGLRFLWFKVELRNDMTREQVFNYDRCDIDSGEDAVLPNLVDMDKLLNLLVEDKEETLAAGELITRNLIFAFPEDRYPTRLRCGELVIPLSLRKG
jgi:hypothetical protein